MIITQKVKISNTPSNRKLYEIENCNDKFFELEIEKLSKGSHIKIQVKCDVCGSDKIISYRTYIKQFKNKNIYTCGKCRSFKIKKTFLEKFGHENVFQNEQIKEKSKNTIRNKYGVEYITQNKDIKAKIIKNNLDKYGVKYYNNVEKTKVTNLKRYGNVCSLHDKDIHEKVKNGWLEKYGTNYPMQNINIFNKMIKSSRKIHKYRDTNITYQSTYEKDFLDKYYDKIEIRNGLSINYDINNTKKVYFSDFYLPKYNLIIEIKSTRTLEMELQKNKIKEDQCIKDGHKFLFVVDKNYDEFENMLNNTVDFFNTLN